MSALLYDVVQLAKMNAKRAFCNYFQVARRPSSLGFLEEWILLVDEVLSFQWVPRGPP
jgi:hypothetical protein